MLVSRSLDSEQTARTRSRAPKSSDPYAPPKAAVDAPRRIDRGAANRDLAAEGHIQAMAVWYRIQAVLVGIAVLAMIVLGGVQTLPIALIVGGVGAFCYFLGSSLMAYKGWARIVVGLFTCLGLLGCVAGVVAEPNFAGLLSNGISGAWNVAILWALFGERGARVFAPGYRIDRQQVRWWVSPFFWLPFLMLGLAFALLFVAGAMAAF